MTPHLILTKATAQPVIGFLRERGIHADAIVREAPARHGPALVDAASRAPVDLLVLDLGTGPGLAAAVLRFRLARPQTRIILLAPGRVPGDREVSAIVAAGVMDVVDDLSSLQTVWDTPADLRAAARWLDPSAVPDASATALPGRERILERRVAVTQRPAAILVAGVGPGVGTTALAAALAGYLDRLGHKVALLDLAPTRGLTHLAAVPDAPSADEFASAMARAPWTPRVDVFSYTGAPDPAAALRSLLKARQHAYVVCDLGDVAAADLPALAEAADLTLVALPGLEHRLPALLGGPRVRALLAAGAAVTWVAVGGEPSPPDHLRALGVPPDRCRHLPLPPALDWPPAYGRAFPPLDQAARAILQDLLPDGARTPIGPRGAVWAWRARRARQAFVATLTRAAGVFLRTLPVVLGLAAAAAAIAVLVHVARDSMPHVWHWLRASL